MEVLHPKGGYIVSTCVEYNIIGGKEEYKAIRLKGFGSKKKKRRIGGL